MQREACTRYDCKEVENDLDDIPARRQLATKSRDFMSYPPSPPLLYCSLLFFSLFLSSPTPGIVISIKTDAWEFPVGTLIITASCLPCRFPCSLSHLPLSYPLSYTCPTPPPSSLLPPPSSLTIDSPPFDLSIMHLIHSLVRSRFSPPWGRFSLLISSFNLPSTTSTQSLLALPHPSSP
eukprot:767009-Hanusia_phi.AAC.5